MGQTLPTYGPSNWKNQVKEGIDPNEFTAAAHQMRQQAKEALDGSEEASPDA